MIGVLLIGGLATRLMPLSSAVAKSLLPVCDRELLHYQIAQLARAGIGRIVLAAGVHAQQLRDFAAQYSGIELLVHEESAPRGTAGALDDCRELLAGERLVVLNADILSTIDIAALLARHSAGGQLATLTGIAVEDPSRYGLFRLTDARLADADAYQACEAEEKDGVRDIAGFIEKPQGYMGDGPHYVNAGAYALEPGVLELIEPGRPVSIERETFPQLIAKQGRIAHYPHSGLWYDIGTFEGYFEANFALIARRFSVGEDWLWGARDDCSVFKDMLYMHKSISLGRGADLFHRVGLMRGVRTGEACTLRNCLMLPGSSLGAGVSATDCIIGPGVEVGDGERIVNAVLVRDAAATPFFPQPFRPG